MSKLAIEFDFDFPVTPDNRGARHKMIVDLEKPPANPALLRDMLLETDLATPEGLKEGLWEMQEWIAYDIIKPNVKFSGHKLTKRELIFDVLLTIDEQTYVGKDHIELDANLYEYNSLKGATADEFDEWISSSFDGYEVTSITGEYLP